MPKRGQTQSDTRDQAQVNQIFESLADSQRRYLLFELLNHERPLSIQHLVMTVVAWETNQSLAAVDEDTYQRVFTALHHVHLPKLADANIIEFDRDRGRVALAEPPTLLTDCLDVTMQSDAV